MSELRDFSDLTTEPDTILLSRSQHVFKDTHFVYETWKWDGVIGSSVILYSEEVKEMSDEDIREFVAPLLKESGSSVTINRKAKYTFVSFNFEVESLI